MDWAHWVIAAIALLGIVGTLYRFLQRIDRLTDRLNHTEQQLAQTTRVLADFLAEAFIQDVMPRERTLALLRSFNPTWEADVADERFTTVLRDQDFK